MNHVMFCVNLLYNKKLLLSIKEINFRNEKVYFDNISNELAAKIKKGVSQLIDEKFPNATPENGSVVTPDKIISQNSNSVKAIYNTNKQKVK